MLSSTVRCGNRPAFWITYPIPRRSFGASMLRVSTPSISTVPDVGSIIRLIIRSEVVLPQPDGPTNTVIFPVGISMVRSSTAAVRWSPSPKIFDTLSKLITVVSLRAGYFGGRGVAMTRDGTRQAGLGPRSLSDSTPITRQRRRLLILQLPASPRAGFVGGEDSSGLVAIGDAVGGRYRWSLSVAVSDGPGSGRWVPFLGPAPIGDTDVVIELGRGTLTCEQIALIARRREPVRLAAGVAARLAAGHAAVLALAAAGPVYGRSTGVGALVESIGLDHRSGPGPPTCSPCASTGGAGISRRWFHGLLRVFDAATRCSWSVRPARADGRTGRPLAGRGVSARTRSRDRAQVATMGTSDVGRLVIGEIVCRLHSGACAAGDACDLR